MMDHSRPADLDRPFRRLLSKAPEVTVFFWTVKILSATVGDSAAHLLQATLGLGLTLTTALIGALAAAALVAQFRVHRYVPGLYWLVVGLIGIAGALMTDNLVDNLAVPRGVVALAFAAALGATFVTWYACEHTLSIHTIDTPRREAFYWLAILFTVALGTAAGDLATAPDGLGLAGLGPTGVAPAGPVPAGPGQVLAAMAFAAAGGLIVLAWLLGLSSVVAFWLAFVLSRPLGVSLGDSLSQSREAGGLGLGPALTTVMFLAVIVGVVVYLSRSRADQPALGVTHAGRAVIQQR